MIDYGYSILEGSNNFNKSPIPLRRDETGNILILRTWFPSYSFKTNDPNEKLCFIYSLVCSKYPKSYSKSLNLIRKAILEYTGAPGIKFNWGQESIAIRSVYIYDWGPLSTYIDELKKSKEMLKNFIFNTNSWVLFRAESYQDKRKFFNVVKPVSNTKFIAQIFFPGSTGRLDIELSSLPEPYSKQCRGEDVILGRIVFDKKENILIGTSDELDDSDDRYLYLLHFTSNTSAWGKCSTVMTYFLVKYCRVGQEKIAREEVFSAARTPYSLPTNYINGNYVVSLFSGYTRTKRSLRIGEELKASFPDSIKIRCYDKETGKYFNIGNTIQELDKLPKVGIEVVIGDDILELPGNILERFTDWLFISNFYLRIIISPSKLEEFNQLTKHMTHFDNISLGLPVTSVTDITTYSKHLRSTMVAYYIEIGVFNIEDLHKLAKDSMKILILGHKQQLGPGIQEKWKEVVSDLIFNQKCGINSYNYQLAFDSLAIEQLGFRDSLPDIEWRDVYLGKEEESLYIDAVEETFAGGVPWSDVGGILDYFKYEEKR